MERIYPPAYAHFWDDGGAWYINHLYNPTNFARELVEPLAHYYLVQWRDADCGILRVIGPAPVEGRSEVKLNRIYLGEEVQGQGIGRALVEWVEATFCTASETVLWLEAMEQQPQARRFYEKLGFSSTRHFAYPYEGLLPEMRGAFRMEKIVTNRS